MANKEKPTVINYTELELAAIEALRANAGEKLSASELGFKPITLTGLRNKFNDERPLADGSEKVEVFSEKVTEICPTCGAKHEYTVYWVK